MESHKENKNETFQQNQERSPPLREWSEEFNCFTVNGILAPIPLSQMLMETEEHEFEPCQSASTSSKKKKRTREGNEEFFFRLFKFPKPQGAGDDDEEYLLEMHEPKTCSVDRCCLFVHVANGNWKIGTCDLAAGDHVVVPVVEDPSPPKFPQKYALSLPESLVGWTVERRKRGNGKEDKFYYHGGRQFRSFVEVAAFILYSTKLKDLKTITTAQQPPHETTN